LKTQGQMQLICFPNQALGKNGAARGRHICLRDSPSRTRGQKGAITSAHKCNRATFSSSQHNRRAGPENTVFGNGEIQGEQPGVKGLKTKTTFAGMRWMHRCYTGGVSVGSARLRKVCPKERRWGVHRRVVDGGTQRVYRGKVRGDGRHSTYGRNDSRESDKK